jgi:hypothetical protein
MSNKKANKGRQTKGAAGPAKITKDTAGVSIQLIPEDEIEGPEGHFATGDDAQDREMVAEIVRKMNAGDIWAWFSAWVRVTFDGLTSDQYLGACSYSNEADFRAGGYFDDMVSEAIDDLNAQIAKRAHFAACAHCAAVSKGGDLPHPILTY